MLALRGTAVCLAVLVACLPSCRRASETPVLPGAPAAQPSTAPSANSLPTLGTGAVLEPEPAWQHLAGAAQTGLGAIALRAAAPIQLDAGDDDALWGDALEIPLPASDDGECPPGSAARFLWDDETLYVLIKTSVSGPPLGEPWRETPEVIVLSADARTRYSFLAVAQGPGVACRLDADQTRPIEARLWKSVYKRTSTEATARFAIHCSAFEVARLDDALRLELLVRTRVDGSTQPKPSDPPLRWFLNATLGCGLNIVCLDQQKSTWPSAACPGNVTVLKEGLACQWPELLTVAQPAAEIQLPLAIAGAPPGPTAFSLRGSLSRCADSREAGSIQLRPAPPASRGRVAAVLRDRVALTAPPSPGLYELRVQADLQGKAMLLGGVHIWVTADWKQDLRQALLSKRKLFEADLAKDPLAISIVLGHVNGLLARIEGQVQPDYGLLRAIHRLEIAAGAKDRHEVPPIATGFSVLQCQTRRQGLVACQIYVPPNYDARLAWPFFSGSGDFISINALVWFSFSSGGPDAAPEIATALASSLSLDLQRAYITGISKDGQLATDYVLKHPDLWAAAALFYRARWSPLWASTTSVRTRLYNNESVPGDIMALRSLHTRLMELGCPAEYALWDVHHGAPVPPPRRGDAVSWFLAQRKPSSPERVRLVTDGYDCPRAYWVAIDAIGESSRLASLSAAIEPDRIAVQVDNVLGYTLDLAKAPAVPGTNPIDVVENGKKIGLIPRDPLPPMFKRPLQGDDQQLHKQVGTSGPIKRLFTEPCVIIAGQGGSPGLASQAQQLGTLLQQKRLFPAATKLLPEADANPQAVGDAHMILVGQLARNDWLKQIAARLPVQSANGRLTADNREYDASRTGLVLLYPSLALPGRCVLILSSETPEVLGRLGQEFMTHPASIGEQDVLVGEPAGDAMPWRWLRVERFDWAWQWPKPEKPLATVATPHPDWRWRQLLAQYVLEATKADVVIMPDVLLFPLSEVKGELGAGTIYRRVRNTWIVEFVFPRRSLEGLERAVIEQGGATMTLRTKEGALDPAKGNTKASEDPWVRVAVAHQLWFDDLVRMQTEEQFAAQWYRDLFNESREACLANVCVADCCCQALEARGGQALDAALSAMQKPPDLPKSIVIHEAMKEVDPK